MLFVCSWLWGDKWKGPYAANLFNGLRRNLKQEYRSVLISDQSYNPGVDILCPIEADDKPLLDKRGCLVRMRMFDAAWQARIGAVAGDKIVNIDIDAVVTGELDPLFNRDDEFTIMQGFNFTNPCPFNGSLWMFRAGERHDVFEDFSFENYAKRKVPFHAFPDDQGWLHHKFPEASSYSPTDGVYAFEKMQWPFEVGAGLPRGARLIAFPGRNPINFLHCDWVRRHWQQ